MALYDGLCMRSVFRRIKLYSLITNTWYDKGWARSLLFYENCIPVDRDNPGTKWIHDSRKILKQGYSINIFPEGHTSKSEEMDSFKPGFLMLASLCKDVPIIPVATIGTYNWFFGKRKKIMVGKPIYPDKAKLGKDSGTLEAYASEFRNIIYEMKQQLGE